MSLIKELAVDLAIVIFIGLFSAGARHLHDGQCKALHYDHNSANASTARVGP